MLSIAQVDANRAQNDAHNCQFYSQTYTNLWMVKRCSQMTPWIIFFDNLEFDFSLRFCDSKFLPIPLTHDYAAILVAYWICPVICIVSLEKVPTDLQALTKYCLSRFSIFYTDNGSFANKAFGNPHPAVVYIFR